MQEKGRILSIQSRDEAILDVVRRAYSFQYEMRERLDSKLNNFVAITATIATLSSGIAFFVLDKIAIDNPLYIPLAVSFLLGICFLVTALIIGLLGYKPIKYKAYPEDPERLIKEYKDFPETQVIRVVAASLALATNVNKGVNAKKARTINWVFYVIILGIVMLVASTVLLVIALGIPAPTNP